MQFAFCILFCAIRFVKFALFDLHCLVCFLQLALCNLFSAIWFVKNALWNLLCNFLWHSIALLTLLLLRWCWNCEMCYTHTHAQSGDLLERTLHLKAGKFGKISTWVFRNNIWIQDNSHCIDLFKFKKDPKYRVSQKKFLTYISKKQTSSVVPS